MTQKISLRDIAKLADVSPATVSRVMNQNGRFSKETEERVKRVIEEYDYSPNQMARGLRTSKNQIIGIVVPDITNEFFAKLIQVIQAKLFDYGFPVAIYNTNESRAIEEKCLRNLNAQNVSGAIYINGFAELEGEMLRGIPTIYFDRSPEGLHQRGKKYITSDNEQGGYLATSELIEKGCKRIAIVTERFGTYVMNERMKGYCRALRENKFSFLDELVVIPEALTFDAARNAIGEVLEKGMDFDGVFCQTDWLAAGCISALHSYKRSVPREVKVVGFDNITASYLCQKPFTTIKQDYRQMGAFAADTLVRMIHGIDDEYEFKVFPVKLIQRQTT